MKINQFPNYKRQKAIKTLYKICARMLADEEFSQISLDNFDDTERKIVERFIGEDIILRREIPSTGLASLGVENISFTYDELRDFILAYYCVENVARTHPIQVADIFEKIGRWPIYEGFFRYAYVIARKHKSDVVLDACEVSQDFSRHYLNNLALLSADIQTMEDVQRVEAFLNDSSTADRDLHHIAWFLFRKRESSEHLNVQILLDHVSKLDDVASKSFIAKMFSRSDYRDASWQDSVSDLLNSFKRLSLEQKLELGVPALALALHFLPYAHWDEREATLNFFAEFQLTKEIQGAIDACQGAVSVEVQNCLREIAEERV